MKPPSVQGDTQQTADGLGETLMSRRERRLLRQSAAELTVAELSAQEDKTEELPALEPVVARPVPAPSRLRSKVIATSAAVAMGVLVSAAVTPGSMPVSSAAPMPGSPEAVSPAEVSITSSLIPQSQIESTIPSDLAAIDTAHLRANYRDAVGQGDAAPGVCQARGANGFTAAMAETTSHLVVWPTAEGTTHMSSPFGWRADPFSGRAVFHTGHDFAGPHGTPIYSIADGVVIHAGVGIDGRSNNLIIVEHEVNGVTFQSWYVHMYDDGVFVSEGEHIGDIGSNGRSTGPHLHFEIHNADGEPQAPLTFLREAGAIDPSQVCA